MAKKAKLGSGKRHAALTRSIQARNRRKGTKKIRNPKALAAAIGRKKYGNAKMSKMAAAGRRRAARGRK